MARKILLADDSVTAQNMGRKILADAGYEVVTVNNGSAALKRIPELKPDLIVLDVYMPGYSGLEVCQRLKENGETSRIPVLLTVGKLEPFKPEEAKRARADGFIVKPFEASELLGALAKLEDKIVPRSEGSKPGRFARSIAAIEEGRYDKNTAPEEDSGWKNRINFPSKKAKTAEEQNGDDPAVYNALNKDLRTVVDQRSNANPPQDSPTATPSVEKIAAEKISSEKVDLGALSALGLPKDVTPEEIAALAAAAAQVQGLSVAKEEAKLAVVASEEGAREVAQAQAAGAEAAAEIKTAEAKTAEAKTAEAKTEANPVDKIEVAPEAKTEEKIEHKAEPKPEQKIDSAAEAQAPADLPGRNSESEPVTHAMLAPESGNEASSPAAVASPAIASVEKDEPVTMAVATQSETIAPASRWTAVAVAPAAEESSVSLENEMHKAFAAFAAAAGHSHFAASSILPLVDAAIVGPTAAEATTAEATTVQPAIPQPIPATEPDAMPNASANPSTEISKAETTYAEVGQAEGAQSEAAKSFEAVASAATEAVSAAVKEFETVAAAYSGHASSAFPEPAPEAPKQTPASPTFEQVASDATAATQEVSPEQPRNEASPLADSAIPEIAESNVAKEQTNELPANDPPAKPESDIATTTAAAWANWRRVRESGGTRPTAYEQDSAAMAAAAGADHNPDSSLSSSDTEVASIVDSVLADLRPKIVEEISRKLGKKK